MTRRAPDERATSISGDHVAPRSSTAARLLASTSYARTVKPWRTRWPMMAVPIRPAPMTPTDTGMDAGSASPGFSCSAEPGLRDGEDNAFLRVHVHEYGAACRRAQRRMLTREQRPRSHGNAEVDRLAEKHLLLHGARPGVLP